MSFSNLEQFDYAHGSAGSSTLLTVLSKIEGLTILSVVEVLTVLSEIEGLTILSVVEVLTVLSEIEGLTILSEVEVP